MAQSESWVSRSEMPIKQEKGDIVATLTESDQLNQGSNDIIEVHVDTAQSPFARVTSGATQDNQHYHVKSSPYVPSEDVTEGLSGDESERRDQVNEVGQGRFPHRIY